MRRFLVLFALTAVVAGCGSGNSHSSTTLVRYQDSAFHFSFKHPSSWKVASGTYKSIGGLRTYVVDIVPTGQQTGVRLTVDQNLVNYSSIPEGKIAPDPNGGGDTFHYHHLTVSGWPSVQIERFLATKMDGIDTIANTRQYSFDAQMITASPPISTTTLDGYRSIVRTLKLPF